MVDAILTGDYAYVEAVVGPAVETVVSSLRHAIVSAPGRMLVAGDFAGIEARIVLALAGAHSVVESIRQHGSRRAYLDMAARIYKRPIDKDKDPEQARNFARLSMGIRLAPDMTKAHLVSESCKLLLRMHYDNGASKTQLAAAVAKAKPALDAAAKPD